MDDDKTHYEVLGLKPNAKHTEVGIAYQRIMGRRRSETAPPDPRGDARIQEAFETLSNLESREYYDEELKARAAAAPLPKWRIALAGLGLAAVGTAGWWITRPDPALQKAAEAPTRIAQAVAPAVGRIERLQVSGKAAEPGVAFSIEEGVMVTSCHRMAPGTQLLVTMLGRQVPATVRTHDEKTGLCQISAPNTGSWPLTLTAIMPRSGDPIYAASVGPKGEVSLIEGKVKRVIDGPSGRVLETTLPVSSGGAGAPIFDAQARVAAIATFTAEGKPVHVLAPEEWRGPMTERSASGKAADEAAKRQAQEEIEEAAKPPKLDDFGRPMLSADPKAVRRNAEKVYSKPSVPDDL